jgi:hypothetical protein
LWPTVAGTRHIAHSYTTSSIIPTCEIRIIIFLFYFNGAAAGIKDLSAFFIGVAASASRIAVNILATKLASPAVLFRFWL